MHLKETTFNTQSPASVQPVIAGKVPPGYAPEAPTTEQVKMRLTSGEDGVFAHFQIGDGYQCGVNLDHIELCKRFCDEYRALSAAPSDSVEEGK